MTRRSRRALPATLTALVLLAASVLVAISAVQLVLGQPPLLPYDTVATTLHDTRWSDDAVAVTGAVATAAGLLLVLIAVVPSRARTVQLDEQTTLSLQGLRNALKSAAQVDGVDQAAVKVRPRKVKAVVRTRRTTADGLADTVLQALEHRLADLALTRPPQVVVRVRAPRSTS